MDNSELSNAEVEFIEIVRAFGFLFKEGYHGKQFSIGGREPGVSFENWIINRELTVFWSEDGHLDVYIKRKKVFGSKKSTVFSIRDYFKLFNCEDLLMHPPLGTFNILKAHATFCQQHLMPVIKGELWTDEIVKQR